MKIAPFFLLAAALSAPLMSRAQAKDGQVATASDWTFNAGAAVLSGPRYAGASRTKTMAIPTFDAKYKDWLFISPIRGIGAEIGLLDGLTGSAALGADFTSRKAKDEARLAGLGDIGAAAAIRLGLDFKAGNAFAGAKLMSRLGSSNGRGTLLEVDAGYNVLASRAGVLGLGLQAKAMDSTYARNFFGVSAAQSLASGLPAFTAGSGLQSVGPFAQLFVPLTTDWAFFGRAQYARLDGDAAPSPITQKRGQAFLLLSVSRRF